ISEAERKINHWSAERLPQRSPSLARSSFCSENISSNKKAYESNVGPACRRRARVVLCTSAASRGSRRDYQICHHVSDNSELIISVEHRPILVNPSFLVVQELTRYYGHTETLGRTD